MAKTCDDCVLPVQTINVKVDTQTFKVTEEEPVFEDCAEVVTFVTDKWDFVRDGNTFKEVKVAPKQPILKVTSIQPVIEKHVKQVVVDNPTIKWVQTIKEHTVKIPGDIIVNVVKDKANAVKEYQETTRYLEVEYREASGLQSTPVRKPAERAIIELTPQPPTPGTGGSHSSVINQKIRVVGQIESPEARPSPPRHDFRRGEQVSLIHPPGSIGQIVAVTTEMISIALGSGPTATTVEYYSPFLGIQRINQPPGHMIAQPVAHMIAQPVAQPFPGEQQVNRTLTYVNHR